MAELAGVFRESRVTKTIVAVDLTNSTAMKEQQPEVTWLNTYAWFFDLLGDSITTYKGTIVKYMGDGAMAVFDEDHPAYAINWAIYVQEHIVEAQQTKSVSCDCSIAITYGKVVEFDTPNGRKDYIGTVVDKAFRLCGVANAKAIFVDTDTIIAAPMNKVQSRLGAHSMPPRTATDYQGVRQSAKVKGFSQPVDYHEISWANSPYGVRKEFVTTLSAAVEPPAPSHPVSPPVQPRPVGWAKKGRVISLGERGFGFIRTLDDQKFWFNADFLFCKNAPAKTGDEVWFNPLEPFPGRTDPRASDVLPLGSKLEGTLEKVIASKGFGFAACTSDKRETKQIFIFLGQDHGSNFAAGDRIQLIVSENKNGLCGIEPHLVASMVG